MVIYTFVLAGLKKPLVYSSNWYSFFFIDISHVVFLYKKPFNIFSRMFDHLDWMIWVIRFCLSTSQGVVFSSYIGFYSAVRSDIESHQLSFILFIVVAVFVCQMSSWCYLHKWCGWSIIFMTRKRVLYIYEYLIGLQPTTSLNISALSMASIEASKGIF